MEEENLVAPFPSKRIYPNSVIVTRESMLRGLTKTGIAGMMFIALTLIAMVLPTCFAPDGPPSEQGAGICDVQYTAIIWANVTSNINRTIASATVHLVGNGTWATNESGVAEISGLLADTNGTDYILWAEMDGYVSSSPVMVTVTPFNTTYVNLTVRGGVIIGTVSEGGAAISQADVGIPELSMNTSTDIDGSYYLEGIKSGTYTVIATAQNHEPLAKIATVPVGGTVALYFSLSSLMGGVSGSVLHSETQEPLERANVSVVVGVLTITVSTDMNGSYYLPNLPAGVYSLTASLEGFNSSSVSGIVVESGVTTEDVDLLLDERTTRLWGVVKAGTVLLVGANVSIAGTDYYGETSVDGEYEIVGVPAGVYVVTAALQGYNNMTATQVEIKRGLEVQLNFNLTGLPGALYGIVIDGETGEDLAGVKVVVLPQRETITNINGEFEFTGLMAGEYIVRFTLDGYQPIEIGSVVITLEETTQLPTIHLEPTRESFGGFVFGFDLPHSMMILALFLTIVILAFAVVLRIRTFEAPDKAPAVYDELDDEEEGAEGESEREERSERPVDEINGRRNGSAK
jgi:hypothetical protein